MELEFIVYGSQQATELYLLAYVGLGDFPGSLAGTESTFYAENASSVPGSGRSPEEGMGYPLQYSRASLVAQMVKSLHTVQTRVQSLGWESLMEEHTATHSSILAWKISIGKGAWQATVHVATKSQTSLSN